MKKILFATLLFFISFPLFVNADNTNYTVVTGDKKSVKEGETITVEYKVYFQNVNKSDDYLGLSVVILELEFDDDIFNITQKWSNGCWKTEIYQDDNGKYYVMASLNGNIDANVCKDGVLYCGPYMFSLEYTAKQTDKTSAVFKIGKNVGIVIDAKGDANREISEEDVKTIEAEGTSSLTVEIIKNEKASETAPSNNSIVKETDNLNISSEIKKETNNTVNKKVNNTTNSNKKQTNTTVEENNDDESNKAYNNYLKILEIDDYKIDFDKHISIYSIEVAEGINEVRVNAVAEANKATVEISGADDLEANNDKILIKVTAENKEEKKYIINVKRIKEEKKEKGLFFEITDEQKKIGIIFAGAVLGLGLIIFIIIRIRDRKIEKGMDKW